MFEVDGRLKKAKKEIKILQKHLGELSNKNLLDIGCSSGIMTDYYADFFQEVDALDIDQKAIEYALSNTKNKNINFILSPLEELQVEKRYDVMICSHIYEHVPDSSILFERIYDLLKSGGVCYFAAGNRYQIYENHYNLYFLSYLPKKLANFYLKITKKGNYYYENHLSLLKLNKITKKFIKHDFTLEVIKYPKRYDADDMLEQDSFKHKIIVLLSKIFYFFIPTYIWVLEKP